MEMRYYNAIKDFGEVYRLFTNNVSFQHLV